MGKNSMVQAVPLLKVGAQTFLCVVSPCITLPIRTIKTLCIGELSTFVCIVHRTYTTDRLLKLTSDYGKVGSRTFENGESTARVPQSLATEITHEEIVTAIVAVTTFLVSIIILPFSPTNEKVQKRKKY